MTYEENDLVIREFDGPTELYIITDEEDIVVCIGHDFAIRLNDGDVGPDHQVNKLNITAQDLLSAVVHLLETKQIKRVK